MVKSVLNNTSTLLSAGQTFVGSAEDSGANVEIMVSIKADRSCLVRVEQSSTGSNWDVMREFSYTASDSKNFMVGKVHQYFRTSVVNNSGFAMGVLRMATYLQEEFSSAVVKGTDAAGIERVIKTDAEGKLLMTFTGEVGPEGKSSYQVALDQGFVGDEDAWLLSLKGEQGLSVKGDQGDKGDAGDSAYQVAVAGGFIGDESAWLASLNGSDGEQGIAGLSAYQVWVQEGNSGTQADYLNSLKGTSIKVLGTLTSAQILALDTNALSVNDAYFASDNYQLFVWDGVSAWVSSGSLRGAEGQAGSDGVDGQDGVGVTAQQASEIAANTLKVGITPQQAADILANNAKISYSDAALVSQHTTAIALNTAKVGITPQQASEIQANTLKVGVTQGVLDDIAANNAKVSYTDAALVSQHTSDIALNTAKVGITPAQAADILANNAKISYTDAALVSQHTAAIALNTAKVGITPAQASEISTNTLKVGISPQQEADILANNSKISYTDGVLVGQHTAAIALNTAKVGITPAQASEISTNTLKVGISPTQAADILANNAKVSFSTANQTALTNATNNISLNTAAIALNTAKLGVQKPVVFYEFTASGVAAATYNGSSGFVKRTLNATDTDGSGDFTLAGGVMTCVTAGTYYINFTANMKAADQFIHKIRKTTALNQADVLFSTAGNASASGTHTASTEGYGIVPCLAGDTFELQVRTAQASGTGGEATTFGVENVHAFVSWCRVL